MTEYDFPDLRIDWDNKHLEMRRSALSVFVNCPRRFYWEYLQGLRRIHPESQIPFRTADAGNAFHAGVEAFWTDSELGHNSDQIDRAAVALRSQQAADSWISRNFPGQSLEKERKLASVMVHGFVDDVLKDAGDSKRTLETKQGRTLAIERGFIRSTAVMGSHYHGPWTVSVHGHVDRLYETAGLLYIEDYKTCAQFSNIAQHLPQMMLYRWLLGDIRVSGYAITQVKRVLRTKPGPHIQREIFPITPQITDYHNLQIRHQLKRIVALICEYGPQETLDYHPNPTGECSWKCPVKDICDTQQRGEDPQLVIDLEYTTPSERTTT